MIVWWVEHIRFEVRWPSWTEEMIAARIEDPKSVFYGKIFMLIEEDT